MMSLLHLTLLWCNMTQYDKTQDKINYLGTKITLTQDGAQRWFSQRVLDEMSFFYSLSFNSDIFKIQQFQIQVYDIHLYDINLPEPTLQISDNGLTNLDYESFFGQVAFQLKIQQQTYPYISYVASGWASGIGYATVQVQIGTDTECSQFIQINNPLVNLYVDDFQLYLQSDSSVDWIFNSIMQELRPKLQSIFSDIATNFVMYVLTDKQKVQGDTRFSLSGSDSSIVYTDLRYIQFNQQYEKYEFDLVGNPCYVSGQTEYTDKNDNVTGVVAVCEGWYLDELNENIPSYITNDNVQYTINKYSITGSYQIQLNHTVPPQIQNYQIYNLSVDYIAHTGPVLNITLYNQIDQTIEIIQVLTNVLCVDSMASWKTTNKLFYLNITTQLNGNIQLNETDIKEINKYIKNIGPSYQDSSYIKPEDVFYTYYNQNWLLASGNFTQYQSYENQ